MALGHLAAEEAASRRRFFEQRAMRWTWLQLTHAILKRAQAPFPVAPVRALDALHLAAALEVAGPRTRLLSLDHRIRAKGGLAPL
ncbi:MAG: hypothetical protein AB1758_36795, partial [Candidatus Eremiobacterota bacterium]